MGLLPRIKTWATNEELTAADLNAEFDNILDNMNVQVVNDYSTNVAQMQATTDPGEVGSESLATNLAGELERLRHILKEITGEEEWYETPSSSIAGLANAIGTGLTDNRLVSGRLRSTSDQPLFLVPNGAATTATLKGATTNFIYYVNGTEYTISTDVNLTGLTAAPSTQNTCLVNDAQAADDYYTQNTGEDGTVIPVDAMGTEISALVGKYAAFRLTGTATEYFLAYVESSTLLSRAMRGFFFDSSDLPVSRAAYTDNDVITLMKLTWVFAKTDGTLTATYNNPVWSGTQPSSPALGDYWYDTAVNKWKVYGVGSYSDANAVLVGCCIQDTTNTVAARSFEFFKNYDELNTHELSYVSATQVEARFQGAQLNVWGVVFKNDRNKLVWDMTANLDSGVTEAASTYYYFYVTEDGAPKISNVKPFDRSEDLSGQYHPFHSWRCVGSAFNNASSNLDQISVTSYFNRYPKDNLKETVSAEHILVMDKVVRFTGATAAEYLPPAAKTKGQTFELIHAGTSLTQVYTPTGFGAELIGSANTFPMHTNGQTLRLYSDGTGYKVTGHLTKTDWSSPATITVTAVTSNPTKGTGTVVDQIYWRRLAEGDYAEVRWEYGHTVGGADGSGIYLFLLPASLIADVTIDEVYTGSNLYEASRRVLSGTYGGGRSNTSVSKNYMHYLYSTTQFAFIFDVTGTGFIQANTGHPWSATTIDHYGGFRFKVSGWKA